MVFNMMGIGLFGGSFDPVHVGHVEMARSAFRYGVEKLLVIPCRLSPHKTTSSGKAPPADGEHRYRMLELAFSKEIGDGKVALSRFELDGPSPSYTCRTLEHCKTLHPGATFTLLMGEDSFLSLPTWARFEEWKNSVEYIIFRRGKKEAQPTSLSLSGLPDSLRGLRMTWAREIIQDISSTALREKAAHHEPLEKLVPASVEEYIDQHRLYR